MICVTEDVQLGGGGNGAQLNSVSLHGKNIKLAQHSFPSHAVWSLGQIAEMTAGL